MTISPFDLILLLGSAQGFILAVLLWVNSKGSLLSNRLLALLIGSLALMSFAVGTPITNRWVTLAIDLLPFFLVMPIGPLIYLYTQSILNPAFRLGKAEKRHFYWTIFDVGAPCIGWIFLIGSQLGFIPTSQGLRWGQAMTEYNTYIDLPRWLVTTTYLLITRQFLNQQPLTDSNQQPLRWLTQFTQVLLAFQLVWLVYLVPYVVPVWRGWLLNQFGWYPIYIPISFLIYWLGLKGYLYSRSIASHLPNTTIAKAASSTLSAETISRVVSALVKAMEQDKRYLDPDLTLDKLGQHLQLPAKLISAVLNQHMHKNINGFINEYRVEDVKRRILDPACAHLTLTGIAFESGFNSQATFQRTFRQLTGMSPGEYLTQQRKNASQILI